MLDFCSIEVYLECIEWNELTAIQSEAEDSLKKEDEVTESSTTPTTSTPTTTQDGTNNQAAIIEDLSTNYHKK